MSWRRWVEGAVFLAITVTVLVIGILQSEFTFTFRVAFAGVSTVVAITEAAFASITFTLFTVVTAGLLYVAMVRESTTTETTDAGHVNAIVPVYRDVSVMARSVESLLESNYADLDVCIVVEPDDAACEAEAERLAEHPDVDYIVNTGRPGTKSGAINYAVEQIDGEYLAVFDADEDVHPDFLPAAMAKLQGGAAVVQGRTVPEPSGVVESLAYAESVLLNFAPRRLLYLVSGFRMAASRAVLLRRSALEAVGGYDEDMLTEDFAFAYECYRERVAVAELLSYPSRIEAAHTVTDWWGQRKRWMTGYAQVFHRLLTTMRPVDDYRNVVATVLCGAMVGGSIFLLLMLSKFAALLLAGMELFFALPLVVAIGATLVFAIRDRRIGAIDRIPLALILVPLIIPFYSFAALKATTEYLFTWQGEWYSVSKGLE